MEKCVLAGSIVQIPQHLLLRASAVGSLESDLYPEFQALKSRSELAREERAILVLLLLLERAKGPASKWATYINFLPKTYGALLVLVLGGIISPKATN